MKSRPISGKCPDPRKLWIHISFFHLAVVDIHVCFFYPSALSRWWLRWLGGRKKGHFFPQTLLLKKGQGEKKVVCMAKGAKMGRDWMAGPGGGGEGGRAVWKWVMSGLRCVGVGDTQNMICACVCVWVKTFTMSLKKEHTNTLSLPHIILAFFIRWYYSAPHPISIFVLDGFKSGIYPSLCFICGGVRVGIWTPSQHPSEPKISTP